MEALLPSSVDTSGLTLDGIVGITAAEQKALLTRFKGDTLVTYKEWKKEKRAIERMSKKNDDSPCQDL